MPENKSMKDKLVALLKQEWRWTLRGEWSQCEVQTLSELASDVAHFIDKLKPGTGKSWVKRNLADVTFQHSHGALSNILQRVNGNSPTSFVWPSTTVNLFDGWVELKRNKAHVVHELGHVLENKRSWALANILGRGPADRMVVAVGGSTAGKPIRMFGGVNLPAKARYKSGTLGSYANNSIADYFAETFSLTIYQPDVIPPATLAWMKKFLLA
jgi:hypothetical protein